METGAGGSTNFRPSDSGVLLVARCQLLVVTQVGVGRVERDIERAAGGQGTGLEAGADLGQQLVETDGRAGADHEVGGGLARDDVGRLAALGHDAVHAIARQQLLAQEADRRLRHDHRVRRVDPTPGEARGVGLDAGVGHGQLLHGDDVRHGHVHRIRVDHEGRVHVLEEAALDEADLAAAPLLGRCAQQRELQAQLIHERGQRQRGTQTGSADDVVTAGVTDTRQTRRTRSR